VCESELGCNWGSLGLSVFFLCDALCTSLSLIVNFLWIVSNSRCRLVKLNHLNLGVVCNFDLIFIFFLLFASHGS
jgi:hypothetical protein